MRRFLYISPYFPPQSRVGALRPLKFARHLPSFGWAPVVLCDLWKGAALNQDLTRAVPDSTIVVRDYSRRARSASATAPTKAPTTTAPAGPKRKLPIPEAWTNPELVPLGEHSIHMPHALAAGRRVLAQTRCEAIMVNADPYAALLVGAQLAKESGLPLVQDLRDPWSVCELRRPRRPAPIRRLVDALERRAFLQSAHVIINTETALADYRAHYPDFDADRFSCIRNHADPSLIGHGSHPGFDRFTLLFLGNFRRFLDGGVLLEVLAALRERGVDPGALQLVVTGEVGAETWEKARSLGVADMLIKAPFVAYPQIGPVMAAADVLMILSNATRGRIPAKLYDYVQTDRPIVTVAQNPELRQLVEQHGGAMFGFDDVGHIADHIQSLHAAGRTTVERPEAALLGSRQASEALAAILDRVTAERRI